MIRTTSNSSAKEKAGAICPVLPAQAVFKNILPHGVGDFL
jgi:hypothetical protein